MHRAEVVAASTRGTRAPLRASFPTSIALPPAPSRWPPTRSVELPSLTFTSQPHLFASSFSPRARAPSRHAVWGARWRASSAHVLDEMGRRCFSFVTSSAVVAGRRTSCCDAVFHLCVYVCLLMSMMVSRDTIKVMCAWSGGGSSGGVRDTHDLELDLTLSISSPPPRLSPPLCHSATLSVHLLGSLYQPSSRSASRFCVLSCLLCFFFGCWFT